MADYTIYLFTLILSFSLIFAYNSLIFSKPIQELCALVDALTGMLAFVTVTMVLILGWLVSYIVRFIFEQRSQEFACYMTMGMERRQISHMFLAEQMILGFLSFLAGSVIGNFIYYGIIQIVYYFFGASYAFDLTYMLPSLGITFLCYLFLFWTVLLFQNRKLRRITVTDLLDYHKKSEPLKGFTGGSHKRNVVLFAVTTIVSGYCLYQAFFTKASDAYTPLFMLIGGTLLLISMLLFYREAGYLIYSYYKKHPRRNLRKEKLFFYRQLTSRLSTNSWRLGILSILGLFAILGLCGSFIPAGSIDEELAQSVPFDLGITQVSKGSPDYILDTAAFEEVITKYSAINAKHEYKLYNLSDRHLLSQLGLSDPRFTDSAMAVSDYNALRQMLGYPSVTLPNDSYLIHCKNVSLRQKAASADPANTAYSLNGREYHLSQCRDEYLSLSGLNGFDSLLVLPDDAFQGMVPATCNAVYMTQEPLPLASYEALKEAAAQMKAADPNLTYLHFYHKEAYTQETKSTFLFIILLCAYTAFICLFIIGTILSVQQLSESRRSRRQFELMLHLGASRSDLKAGITRHLALYFLLPLLLPLVYSCIYLGALISQNAFSTGIILTGTLFSCITLSVIYGLYFLVTNHQYQNYVLKEPRYKIEDLL